ncbi:hypothetical protein P171DRAFT_255338 [Karstenula rhodostoma CBS 690.94]|uniref:Uncharacterized protein n=1 Tax=Karstenula rhodostoma CBS 690.94 TaxID=1392251 RepID=A0A9P4PJH7_9PLEO|nr:hypothetical protein P171DRAFT_255338 [Karstenula rhodostoma CBS 690.94]
MGVANQTDKIDLSFLSPCLHLLNVTSNGPCSFTPYPPPRRKRALSVAPFNTRLSHQLVALRTIFQSR